MGLGRILALGQLSVHLGAVGGADSDPTLHPNIVMLTPTRIINTSTTSRTALTVSSGCSSAGEGYGIRNHLLREKLAPRIGSDNTVVREAVLALEKDDAILGAGTENAVHGKATAVTTVEDGLQRLDLIAPRA